MNISCLIPSFNGLHLLQKHLSSVLTALDDGDELILIDDASTDETVAWLKKEYNLKKAELELASGIPGDYDPVPHADNCLLYTGLKSTQAKKIIVKVLRNKSNYRFAASVNLAACLVKNEFFLLLNNDVSVAPKTVRILKDQVSKDPTIFAIGCLEFEHDAQGSKSGKNKLWFERGLYLHSKASNFTSGETAWASGGSALFSTEKWLKLRGFDREYYPAYWEDIDLSYRARKRGWKVVFNADAVVFHKHESTNAAVFGKSGIDAVSWQNSFRFAWKHSNVLQKISILFWFPYWQIQRLRNTKGTK